MTSMALPSSTNVVQSTMDWLHQITQAQFSLYENILGISNHLSAIHMTGHGWHKNLFRDITGDKNKAVQTVAPMNLFFYIDYKFWTYEFIGHMNFKFLKC